MLSFLWIYLLAFVSLTLKSPIRGEDYWAFILKILSLPKGMMEFCNLRTKFCEVTIQMKPPCLYFQMVLFVSKILNNEIWENCWILPLGTERVKQVTFCRRNVHGGFYVYLARIKFETPELEVFIVLLEIKNHREIEIAITNGNLNKYRNKWTTLCISD